MTLGDWIEILKTLNPNLVLYERPRLRIDNKFIYIFNNDEEKLANIGDEK